MPRQVELVDAETGQKFPSTELLAGATVQGFVVDGTPEPGKFIGWSGTAAQWQTVVQPVFGGVRQVPFMNASATNFSYSTGFTFDGVGLNVSTTNGFVRVSSDTPASSGNVRGGLTFAMRARTQTGDTRTLLDWGGGTATERLLLGVDASFSLPAVVQATLYFSSRGGLTQNNNSDPMVSIELGEPAIGGDVAIAYQCAADRYHQFMGRTRWLTDRVGFGVGATVGAGTLEIGQHSMAAVVGPFTGNLVDVHSGDIEASNQPGAIVGGATTLRGGSVSVPTANAGATYTGGAATLLGGSVTSSAGTRNGGNAIVKPGSGTTANGFADLQNSAGVSRVRVNSTGLGFFAATPVAKPTVSGSRGGNAALQSLVTALASLGLVTDGTSA